MTFVCLSTATTDSLSRVEKVKWIFVYGKVDDNDHNNEANTIKNCAHTNTRTLQSHVHTTSVCGSHRVFEFDQALSKWKLFYDVKTWWSTFIFCIWFIRIHRTVDCWFMLGWECVHSFVSLQQRQQRQHRQHRAFSVG